MGVDYLNELKSICLEYKAGEIDRDHTVDKIMILFGKTEECYSCTGSGQIPCMAGGFDRCDFCNGKKFIIQGRLQATERGCS